MKTLIRAKHLETGMIVKEKGGPAILILSNKPSHETGYCNIGYKDFKADFTTILPFYHATVFEHLGWFIPQAKFLAEHDEIIKIIYA